MLGIRTRCCRVEGSSYSTGLAASFKVNLNSWETSSSLRFIFFTNTNSVWTQFLYFFIPVVTFESIIENKTVENVGTINRLLLINATVAILNDVGWVTWHRAQKYLWCVCLIIPYWICCKDLENLNNFANVLIAFKLHSYKAFPR